MSREAAAVSLSIDIAVNAAKKNVDDLRRFRDRVREFWTRELRQADANLREAEIALQEVENVRSLLDGTPAFCPPSYEETMGLQPPIRPRPIRPPPMRPLPAASGNPFESMAVRAPSEASGWWRRPPTPTRLESQALESLVLRPPPPLGQPLETTRALESLFSGECKYIIH
jgi:hypothetical protein